MTECTFSKFLTVLVGQVAACCYLHYFLLACPMGDAVEPGEEEGDLMNNLITTLFVEQPELCG